MPLYDWEVKIFQTFMGLLAIILVSTIIIGCIGLYQLGGILPFVVISLLVSVCYFIGKWIWERM